MKLGKIKYNMLAFIMSTMVFCSAPIVTYAETLSEDSNTEDVADTQSENGTASENGVSENIATTGNTTGGEIQMSGLPTNNGLEIASTFPEELMPKGFHKSSCTYEGQTIEIAYMDKGNGEVVLAYLADSNGENGGFYMCDINTANMTDFVQIFSGEDKYIIVLDPGDVIIPPNGFTKANLQWYGKTVTAWILPNDAESADTTEAPTEEQETTVEQSQDESTAKNEKSYASALFYACAGAGKTLTVYAAQAESSDEVGEALPASDTQAAEGSGIVEASPSEYFLVYAINQDGVIGFYMYDTKESTYQRYVAVSSGESQQVTQYRSSAQKRLFVIAALAILLVICIFILVNVILQLREYKDHYDDDDDDDDHEMDEMRQRVAKKEKTHIKTGRRELNYLMDKDDDEDDDDEDDEDDDDDDTTNWKRMEVKYNQPEKKNQVKPMPERQESQTQRQVSKPASKSVSKPDSKPTSKLESKPVSRPRPQPELDDDFEFEFIDI
ncbi:MAG: hypothetical protein PHY47_02255 [Lachnospiraceae bacterium]|nr:hypothetical protein [Lachnospiraceae bacterium]